MHLSVLLTHHLCVTFFLFFPCSNNCLLSCFYNLRQVNATLADAVEVAIKRAVLSPDYMRPAWRVRRCL